MLHLQQICCICSNERFLLSIIRRGRRAGAAEPDALLIRVAEIPDQAAVRQAIRLDRAARWAG
jgi:hypothetical protein